MKGYQTHQWISEENSDHTVGESFKERVIIKAIE